MSNSRVTFRSMSQSSLFGIQQSLNRTQDLQNQLSSGKRVAVASDDPSASDSSMKLRSQLNADVQFLRNADTASTRLNSTDNALQGLSDRLQRVRALLVQSRDGALGADSQTAIAAEVSSIKDDAVNLYNTRVLNRPIFGGTVAGTDAVDSTGAYVGNDAPIVARVSRNTTVRIDTKGSDVGADTVPALLDKIADDVLHNPSNASADMDSIDAELSKINGALGDVGARTALVNNTKSGVDSERIDLTQRISDNEDADLPETIMNLQSQQVAYQAALGAASKLLTVSLADFLK